MTAQIETFKSELPHDFNLIPRHFTLAIIAVVGQADEFARVSVAAQIGGDNCERFGESRRNLVPDRVRLRIAVKEQQWRATAANHAVNLEAILEFEIALCESLEQNFLRFNECQPSPRLDWPRAMPGRFANVGAW